MVGVVAHARKGEFDHVGAPDQACPCGSQTRHGLAVRLGRRLVFQDDRACLGDVSLDVKQVLDGHCKACERALTHLRLAGCVLQHLGGELHENMLAGWALRHSQAIFSGRLGGGGSSPDGLTGGDQVSFHGEGHFRVGQDAIILRLCSAQVLSFECHVRHTSSSAQSKDPSPVKFIRESVPSRCHMQF